MLRVLYLNYIKNSIKLWYVLKWNVYTVHVHRLYVMHICTQRLEELLMKWRLCKDWD